MAEAESLEIVSLGCVCTQTWAKTKPRSLDDKQPWPGNFGRAVADRGEELCSESNKLELYLLDSDRCLVSPRNCDVVSELSPACLLALFMAPSYQPERELLCHPKIL